MIKLTDLLKEVQNGKKAIIMAGAAGVGKGTFIKDIKNKYPQVKSLNPDDFFNAELKGRGVSLDLKNVYKSDPEGRSISAQAMGTARGKYEKEIQSSLDNPILIFDITSNSYNPILKLKTRLEENGYEVMMVYLFVSLDTVLDRNDKRFEKSKGEDRSLFPPMVVKTWKGVVENFEKYQQLFGDNFIPTTTDDTPISSYSYEELKDKYIKPYYPDPTTTKEKTEKEVQQAEKERAELLQLLKKDNLAIQNIIKNFKTKDEVLGKINTFLG
jgi:adenylate kinase family enzyme